VRTAAGLSLLAAAGGLGFVVLFFGGGSGEQRLFWIGSTAVVLAAAALLPVLAGAVPLPVPRGAGALALGLLAALVAWLGVTIWWSIAPDRSWDALNRGLVYLAFAVLGLFVGALVPRASRAVLLGLAVLLAATLGWALLGKVFPALFADGDRITRLREPVDYWNALALLADVALVLSLWIANRRRAVGALGAYAAIVAVLLTYSRAGVLVAVVLVALWLWVGERRESVGALAAAVPVGLAVAAIALALPGIADDFQPRGTRERDGAVFAAVFLLGAVAVWLLGRRRLHRREQVALGALAAALMLAGVGALAARGDWLAQFRADAPQVTQSPGRLGSASSSNRIDWWGEAWQLFEEAPLEGKGAATFEIARRPIRDSSLVTTEPHNFALQLLAETGLVGLLLGAGAAALALATGVSVVRRRRGPERAEAVALTLVLVAYVLHALVDIDWDFVAVSAPAFFVFGVLAGLGAVPRRLGFSPVLGLAAIAGTFAVLYSLTAPWLSARRVESAYSALASGHLAAAGDRADEARELNPLSIEPFWARALAEAEAGEEAAAVADYERAALLQPENSDTWYSLGAYEYRVGRYGRAYRNLDWAYGLDPWGPAGRPGGLLDQVRARFGGRPPSPR
jgi:O-antigen ligase